MELLKKLKIKNDVPLHIINAPDNCIELFAMCTIKNNLAHQKTVTQLVLFVQDGKSLLKYFTKLKKYISHDTLFWICYPKKSGKIKSDLVLMQPWNVVLNSGFRGQASVSFNDDWTAMRFTSAPKKAATICDLPMHERKVEGIDFINRTIHLPPDVIAAFRAQKGLQDFFNTMSFTHKKEFMQSIADAKKPETRARRIEKMIEMLLQKMKSKKA